jgi:hypothetical protein
MNLVRDDNAVAVIVVHEPAAPAVANPSKGKQTKRRGGFEGSDRTAVNVLADWIEKITELFLGGIIRSILLIEKGTQQ